MASLADALARTRRPAAPSGSASTPAGPITYTHTRVVEADPALLRENRIISVFPSGPVVDAYKILCIQVLQRLRELGGNALAVVSPGENEGKTLTAINLAISLAREVDQTVLLVDADLRRPGVHRHFGMAPGAGLSDHLISDVPLERILVNPGVERFVVLPGGRPLQNSTEMLGSARMVRLVQDLKSRYPNRIVVFDLPPVLSMADTLAFSPYVDAAMMVVQENRTARDDVQRAAQMLSAVPLLGTVLNDAAGPPAEEPDGPRRGWIARLFGRGRE